MWRCTQCGKEVATVEIKKYSLNEKMQKEDLNSMKEVYQCLGCSRKSYLLTEIAEWVKKNNK